MTSLQLTDPPDDRRTFASLNSKTGEALRWIFMLAVGAIVSYYTAVGTLENRLTALETTQQNQFLELRRSLEDFKANTRDGISDLKSDIRDLRNQKR